MGFAEKYPLKPTIVISKCIEFDSCRYNGQMISDHFVSLLKEFITFIPVCPELEVGLGVPRSPIRIVSAAEGQILYQPATGLDITEKMDSFIRSFLDGLGKIDGFLLKHRSPSCGPSHVKVYAGIDSKASNFTGRGFFGKAVLERFGYLPIEDEGRLKNFTLREHFLTGIFARARFRSAKAAGKMGDLVDFHTKHKYLFMALNQSRLKTLGKIVANHQKLNHSEVIALYGSELHRVLSTPPKLGKYINVLLHLFGGISERLSTKERNFFLDIIEEYRDERIPLSAILRIIQLWAVRFEDEFLLHQVFLRPYPRKLVEITDSGKGKDLK